MRLRWKVRTLLVIVAIIAVFLTLDRRRSREIRPMDLIDVEVLSAVSGNPITAERLVRPDGKITLGYYGEVYVAGLTPSEARAKIVVHLRRYQPDALGLLEPFVDANGTRLAGRRVSAYQTDRVSVWVVTKNSSAGFIDRIIQAIRRYM
jgi:polysaccharide export outer membrane protein